MSSTDYERNVFINCPFDEEYAPMFEAIVFALYDLDFHPRSARERLDSGETRLSKIAELISASRYSIHDLSRTELDATTSLPRFNMPLELGMDLGCRWFGTAYANKSILIFDSEKYRYQQYVSDIAGLDILHHGGDPSKAVLQVRHWLRTSSGISLRAGKEICERYFRFRGDLPTTCDVLRLDIDDLSFADFSFAIAWWIRKQA